MPAPRTRRLPITTGTVLRKLDLPGFTVTETVQPMRRIGAHRHARAHVSFLLAGEYTEDVDGQRFDCTVGSVLIKPANVRHSNDFLGPALSLIVELDAMSVGQFGATAMFAQPCQLDASSELARLVQIRREACYADDASRLIVQGTILEVLGNLLRPAHDWPSNAVVERAVEYVRANFATSFTLEDLGLAAGMTVPRLTSYFRARMGCSVGEYQRRLRVDRAMTLLQQTRTPICSVAGELGFADQSHFTRVFRQLTGTTPARFRREARTS